VADECYKPLYRRVSIIPSISLLSFAAESSERLRLFGALALGLNQLGVRLKSGGWIIGPPAMDQTIDEHQSDEQELIKQ
jgi:hypothetical protein